MGLPGRAVVGLEADMWMGLPARAMVELEKALEENDRCRAPLLVTRYRENEVSVHSLHLWHLEWKFVC